MKKLISIVLLCAMLVSCFAGCGMRKGQIVGNSANYENLAFDGNQITVPKTNPTTDISTYAGANLVSVGANVLVKVLSTSAATSYDPSAESITAGTSTKTTYAFVFDYETPSNSKVYKLSTTTAGVTSGSAISDIDISWYTVDENGAPSAESYDLNDAADFAGFMYLLSAGGATDGSGNACSAFPFTGITINLKKHIDMNEKKFAGLLATQYFEGHFDGQGHAIYNFTVAGFGSSSKGIFGLIRGEASIKNLSLLNSSISVGVTNTQNRSGHGVFVGDAVTQSGKTITFENLYTNCNITGTAGGSHIWQGMGGIVGTVKGDGNITITNCEYAGTLNMAFDNTASTPKGVCQYVGGLVGRITTTGNVSITNCVNSGSVSSNNESVAGIVGQISNSADILLEDCVNSGNITGKTHFAGGIVARIATISTVRVEITDCDNSGDVTITGTGYRFAGIIGGFEGKAEAEVEHNPTLIVQDCDNTGDIKATNAGTAANAGNWAAGIAGYVFGGNNATNLMASCQFINCTSSGEILGNRCSAGLVAHVQRSTETIFEDCRVTGNMNFKIHSTSNRYVGGLVARIDSTGSHGSTNQNTTMTVTGCSVTGTLTVSEGSEGAFVGAALIGSLYAGSLTIGGANAEDGNTVNARIVRNNLTGDNDDIYYFLGTQGGATIALDANNTYYRYDTTSRGGIEATPINRMDSVGMQYRIDAETKKADIRYVFGITEMVEDIDNAIGFDVGIKVIENNELSKDTQKTVYSAVVYKKLNGTAANGSVVTYTAGEDQYADYTYFAVVTIANIPESAYVVEDGDIHIKNGYIDVEPFFQTEDGGTKRTHDKITTIEQNEVTIGAEDFSATKPSKFESATGIFINQPNITNYVVTGQDEETGDDVYGVAADLVLPITCTGCEACVTASSIGNKNQFALKNTCTCTNCTLGWSANGTTLYKSHDGAPWHFYINQGSHKTEYSESLDRLDAYYSFTFTVDTTGTYDFCFRLRVNEANGATATRYALIQIDDQAFDDQTVLHYSVVVDDVDGEDTEGNRVKANHDSYIVGYSAELTAGTHTITFRLPYGEGEEAKDAPIHIRDIYLVEAAA